MDKAPLPEQDDSVQEGIWQDGEFQFAVRILEVAC